MAEKFTFKGSHKTGSEAQATQTTRLQRKPEVALVNPLLTTSDVIIIWAQRYQRKYVTTTVNIQSATLFPEHRPVDMFPVLHRTQIFEINSYKNKYNSRFFY